MSEILIGRKSSYDFFDPNDYKLFLRKGEMITPKIAERLKQMGIRPSFVIEGLVEWMAMGEKKGKSKKGKVKAWARVEVGEGKFLINNKEANEYFPSIKLLDEILTPLKIANLEPQNHDIYVKVEGSSPKYNKHRRAIAFALAGALVCMANNDKSLIEALERQGYRHFCYRILSLPG